MWLNAAPARNVVAGLAMPRQAAETDRREEEEETRENIEKATSHMRVVQCGKMRAYTVTCMLSQAYKFCTNQM